jgi:flagellar biosynthesis protein FlhF
MQYFTIQARSNKEAIQKMKAAYGEEARILTHRSVRLGGFLGMFSTEGVEVTGYISEDGAKKRRVDVEEEKKRILETVRKEQTLQLLLKEIQGLREAFTAQAQAQPQSPPLRTEEVHPSFQRMDALLRLNEFPEDFIDEVRERSRREFSLEQLENYGTYQSAVVEWIGERILLDPPISFDSKGPRLVAVVGPTGVGKTTTIAKLAAIYGIGGGRELARKVRIITIDNYRIAAKQQIETYAEIMRIPVSLVETSADLEKAIALSQEADLVLIDTIGRSPRDLAKLAEMKEILDSCGTGLCVYLAIAATTKTSDTEEILQQFEPFKYRSIILTKLDETMRIGNIIASLARHRKALSYVCDGQGVPQDLEEAAVLRLLMNMEGFRINRESLEKKFGSASRGN